MNEKRNFWHEINCAMTQEQRNKFNAWKLDLYLASEQARDAARWIDGLGGHERAAQDVMQKTQKLHDIVCLIPTMFE